MEIDEVAARIVRGYWPLLIFVVVLPMLLVNGFLNRAPELHTASARLVAEARGSESLGAGEAAGLAVSQVKAYGTSQDVVATAIGAVRVKRDPRIVATRVEATGVGTSRLVELTVKDEDPEVARQLTDALGAEVVSRLNQDQNSGAQTVLDRIDKQLADLRVKRTALKVESQSAPLNTSLQDRLESVQAQMDDLTTQRKNIFDQIQVAGKSSLAQRAVLKPTDNGRTTMLALAGLLGLIVGVLAVAVMEAIRPTVPGPQRVARRLDVPLLGRAYGTPAHLADMGRRVRLAAKRQGVTQVALVSAGKGPLPADLVSRVAAAVYGDSADFMQGPPPPLLPYPPDDLGDGGLDQLEKAFEDSSPSTSVVRSPSAIMSRQRAPSPSPTAQRAECHVHAFEDIDPGADTEGVGVVTVAGPVTQLADLQAVRDLVEASGWPLLGVVGINRRVVSANRRFQGLRI